MSENSAEGLRSSGDHYWVYVSMRIHPKNAASSPKKLSQLYLVVQQRAQLEHSSHIVKFSVKATCWTSSSEVYWRKWLRWQAILELCHRNPNILEMVLNQIMLSSSTAGKSTSMQVIKQPEHRRTSITEEQKLSFFQTNYD